MKTALIILAYRLCLDWIYENWICVYYGYYGFKGELSFACYIESMIFLVIGTALMKLNNKASSIVLHFIYLMYFVPFTSMVAFDAFDDGLYKYLYMLYWVILVTLYSIINKFDFKPSALCWSLNNENRNVQTTVFYIIVLILICNILYIGVVHTGFNFTLNMYDIYSIRSRESAASIPSISTYLLSASKLCIPILIFSFYEMKKYCYVLLMIVFGFLSYVTLALKAVAFIEIITLIIIIFKIKYNRIKLMYYTLLFFILSIAEYLINNAGYLIEFIIRRIFFLTNLLSYQYYDYFKFNEPDFFRSSFLRWFGFSSHFSDTKIVKVIGRTYYGTDMPANNGLLADVFANLGIMGIVVMPIIIVCVLCILDRCTEHINPSMLMLPCLVIASLFIDTFLTVALLTHGLILSFILFKIAPIQS